MGMVIWAASLAMAEITGVDIIYLIVSLGIIGIVYTCAGGMRAVVWTDVIQFFILFGGALFTVVFILVKVGSIETFFSQGWELITTSERTYPIFSLDIFESRTVFGFLLSFFFWYLATLASDQVAIQRYLATKDIKQARRTLWTNYAAEILLTIVLIAVGVALLVYYDTFTAEIPEHLSDLKKMATRSSRRDYHKYHNYFFHDLFS